jgi:hypothetical protein
MGAWIGAVFLLIGFFGCMSRAEKAQNWPSQLAWAVVALALLVMTVATLAVS